MDKVFLQVLVTKEERDMLKQIADTRGMSMSQAVRSWIRDAHRRVQK